MKLKKLKRRYYQSDRYYKGKRIESWQVQFQYYDYEGNLKTAQPRFKTEKLAKAGYDALVRDEALKCGIFAPPELTPKPEKPMVWTFREYALSYRDEKLKSIQPSGKPTFKSEVQAVIDYFGDKPLAEIGRAQIKKFKEHLEEKPVEIKYKVKTGNRSRNPITKRMNDEWVEETKTSERAVSTINKHLTRAMAIIRHAALDKIVTPDNFEQIISAANANKRERWVSYAEFERVLASCDKDYLKLLMIGLYELGGRLCEVQEIKKSDVSLDNKIAQVWNSKKKFGTEKSFRKCYLSDFLIAALKNSGFNDFKNDDYLFYQGDVKHSFDTVREKSGVEHFQLRDLRKSHYNNLLASEMREITCNKQIAHQLTEKLPRRIYNLTRDDLLVAEFQKYEEFSRRERENIMLEAEILV